MQYICANLEEGVGRGAYENNRQTEAFHIVNLPKIGLVTPTLIPSK